MGLTLWLLGCARPCPEGQVLQDGVCEDYEAGEPVQAEVWRPEPGTAWQWQLTGEVDWSLDVPVYDVDLVEASLEGRGDRTLVCYFSAGSWEDFRDDVAGLPEEALGKTLDGWEDERW